ncbi:hypothetical protein PM025_15495 [Halorubrum ezzemoulense]|uniref:hypothetical protein n=1 Tax=Halorubrum ezzemoulense TaxID=337243 RepID=UPI00232F9ACF|nr:hypothetical protein [Halorubrum ezzemoulense]MDB2265514.1 hypothetical protein [Halorubrum ezzemoulense]
MTESVIEEYAHSCRIIEEEREDDYNQYHYEGPMGRIKTFENPDKARLYADVQTVTGGFREEKTGERGAPPAVARSREDVLMAYYAAQPTMSMQWVSAQFDLPEDRVREYVQSLRNRAEQMREDQNSETDHSNSS